MDKYNTKSIQRLLRLRNLVRTALTTLTMASFFLFVGAMTFYPNFFARPITADSSVTLGLLAAVSVIAVFVLLEFLYVLISRWVLDPLQKQIVSAQTDTIGFGASSDE